LFSAGFPTGVRGLSLNQPYEPASQLHSGQAMSATGKHHCSFCQLSKTIKLVLVLQATSLAPVSLATTVAQSFRLAALWRLSKTIKLVLALQVICFLPLAIRNLCLISSAHSRARSVSCLRLVALRQLFKTIKAVLVWQVNFTHSL